MSTPGSPALRVGYVPGVTVTKWTSLWRERFARVPLEVVEVAEADQRSALDGGEVDLCFVRLPIGTDGLHLIPLYEEVPVAWVSKDHLVAAVEEVTLADLADETVLTEVTEEALDRVGVAAAVLHVPLSVARSRSRRDLTYRPIADAPSTRIGLAWLAEHPHPQTEEFIGIVRGRTANSSRTQQERASRKAAAPPPAQGRGGRRNRQR